MTIAQDRAATAESSLEGLPDELLLEMYARMWQARRVSQRLTAAPPPRTRRTEGACAPRPR